MSKAGAWTAQQSLVSANLTTPVVIGVETSNTNLGGNSFRFSSTIATANESAFTMVTLTTSTALANGVARITLSGMLGDGDGVSAAEFVVAITRVSSGTPTVTISSAGLTAQVASSAAHNSAVPTLTLSATPTAGGIVAIKGRIQAGSNPVANNVLCMEGQFVAGLGLWTCTGT